MTLEDNAIVIQPDTPACASVIWLHGLGADGNDFVSIVEALDLPADHGIRFIFPHAPVMPVSLNGGMHMRAWYDIIGIGEDFPEDEAGISRSQQHVDSLIDGEVKKGVGSDKIIIAGFSQGGSMALHAGLRYSTPLAGVLCMSGYLSMRQSLADQMSPSQKHTPVMMMHGLNDTVVDVSLGKHSCKYLQKEGLNLSWIEYPMEHTVCQSQLEDIRQFISNCLIKA